MKKTLTITSLFTLSLIFFAGSAVKESQANHANSNNDIVLESFTSIDIDALSPDIEIIAGDEYSIDYKLHDREHIDIFEVKNNTLIFDTGYHFEFDVDYGNFYIKITVPEDVILDNINIKTVAGTIYTDIDEIDTARFVTTSGKITVENSGISDLYAKNASENIEVDGILEQVDISTVSGHCEVISDNISGNIQTVSGNITVKTKETSVSANSFGKVSFFGNQKGYRYEASDSNLDISSVSGRIVVE